MIRPSGACACCRKIWAWCWSCVVALGLALLLRAQVEGGVREFQAADAPLRLAYPATWRSASSLQDAAEGRRPAD